MKVLIDLDVLNMLLARLQREKNEVDLLIAAVQGNVSPATPQSVENQNARAETEQAS